MDVIDFHRFKSERLTAEEIDWAEGVIAESYYRACRRHFPFPKLTRAENKLLDRYFASPRYEKFCEGQV